MNKTMQQRRSWMMYQAAAVAKAIVKSRFAAHTAAEKVRSCVLFCSLMKAKKNAKKDHHGSLKMHLENQTA
jgi:hypothetical protein